MLKKCVLTRRIIQQCGKFKSTTAAHTSNSKTYREAFAQSVNCSQEFWAERAERLEWFKKWEIVLSNPDSPFPKWFEGGLINITHNCLDRHLADGHGKQTAIIYDSPVTGCRMQYTYETLLNQVSALAGYLSRECGVQRGDRVLLYMPMIPECMIAMLASARIGAIHTVVFGGFAAEQLAIRIRNSKPKVIFTASYGVEPKRRVDYKTIVVDALNSSKCTDVDKCVFYQRPQLPRVPMDNSNFFVDWDQAISTGKPHDAVPVASTDPLYLIYTSGTTGDPKGIVRDTGGYGVALKYSMDEIYDTRPGDVWWASSEFGWVVGHSYCCYAPLLQRATSVIYEGKPIGTPDAAQYFRVAAEYKINGWFMTPSALRSIHSVDPELTQSKPYRTEKVNLNSLRNVFVAGEKLDHFTARWLVQHLPPHVRVCDTWWQTESGWPMTSACLGYSGGYLHPQGLVAPEGSSGLPVPGYNIQLVEQEEGNTSSQSLQFEPDADEDSKEMTLQRILVKLPMPPGTCTTIWENGTRFKELYFEKYPGYYDTMDLGYRDDRGFIYILSRADDVINVSGHRLSTCALEEACMAVPGVVDCAVIAIPHEVKGHIPFGVLVVSPHIQTSEDAIIAATCQSVRKLVGPVAALTKACIVPKLPKTRSGKISRSSLADMAAGKPVRVPITIDDITVYETIHDVFRKCGFNPSVAPKSV